MGSLCIWKGRAWRRDFEKRFVLRFGFIFLEHWILFCPVLLCISNRYLISQFVLLIDGMIRECGSEVGRLTRDLIEMQGKLYESEAMLKAIEDSHSAKVSTHEVQIGELERDLGKTARSLLKEKKARKTMFSEVRRLQRQIESGEGSTNRGIKEAKDALRVEFQTRLAKISDFQGSLECIRSRDLALATIDGGMAVVQALQGETPSSLEAEETRLPACKGGLAAVDRSFDLILADLKSECFLPTCSEDTEGQDPAVGENRGGAAPSLEEAMREGEVEIPDDDQGYDLT